MNTPSESSEQTAVSSNPLDHELRPRLNAIVEIAELLKMKSGSDENVQRILSVARDLLNKVPEEQLEPPGSTASTVSSPNASCDVLYIEDNPISFGAVKLLLKSQRALTVVQGACGENGISLAQAHRPRLILLDLNLPDIHGSEVISRLQTDPATAHIPVVVISADATASQIERLLVLGAKNYLTKPFDMKPFLAVVDEALSEKSGRATSKD
ncbi:MAG: PleD family two-component system response regulator [Chthoniobacterales bacterium]